MMEIQQMIGAVYESNLKKHIKDAIADRLRACKDCNVDDVEVETDDGDEDADE